MSNQIEPRNASRTFWENTIEERLTLPYCTECEEFFFYPRNHCPRCMSDVLEHRDVSGRARLLSYSTVYRPPLEELQKDAPYVNAVVELEEGPRMFTNMDVESEDELEVGMEAEVTFVETDGDYKLPYFHPRDA